MKQVDWLIEKWEKKYSYVKNYRDNRDILSVEYSYTDFQLENISEFIKDLKKLNEGIFSEEKEKICRCQKCGTVIKHAIDGFCAECWSTE
jgi:ABC-type ATPase with predicted acetyltransferase domain